MIASPTRMESGRSRPGPWPSSTGTKYALAFDESAILARCGTSAGRLRNASPSDARPERASSCVFATIGRSLSPRAFPAVTYGTVPDEAQIRAARSGASVGPLDSYSRRPSVRGASRLQCRAAGIRSRGSSSYSTSTQPILCAKSFVGETKEYKRPPKGLDLHPAT